jgi:hypothetical protein
MREIADTTIAAPVGTKVFGNLGLFRYRFDWFDRNWVCLRWNYCGLPCHGDIHQLAHHEEDINSKIPLPTCTRIFIFGAGSRGRSGLNFETPFFE